MNQTHRQSSFHKHPKVIRKKKLEKSRQKREKKGGKQPGKTKREKQPGKTTPSSYPQGARPLGPLASDFQKEQFLLFKKLRSDNKTAREQITIKITRMY
jgi:hypothetical protein